MIHVLVAALSLAGNSLSLERGGSGDANFRYWAVNDTFLDSGTPDRNYGRDPLLDGGPGKTILVRFGDLNRVLSGVTVVSASIALVSDIPESPVLVGAYALDRPWQEGDGKRGLLSGAVQPAKPKTNGANWKNRGDERWSVPGAIGSTPIPGVTLSVAGGIATIQGLGTTIEAMRRQPAQNFGIALKFANAVSFRSSDAPRQRPRLVLETVSRSFDFDPGDLAITRVRLDSGRILATVVNRGSKAFAPGVKVTFSRNGVPFATEACSSAIDLRGRIDVSTGSVTGAPITQSDVITASLEPRDGNPANDYGTLGTRSLATGTLTPIQEADLADAVRFINETVFPHSRFSFAREGVTTRLQLEPGGGSITPSDSLKETIAQIFDSIGVGFRTKEPSGDVFPGLSGWGDTRDDINASTLVPLIYDPVDDPAAKEIDALPTDLLCATQVAMLQFPDFETRLPKRIGVQVFNVLGEPLGEAKISLRYRDGDPIAEGALGKQGSWIPTLSGALPWSRSAFAPNTTPLRFTIQKGSLQTDAVIQAWRLVDFSIRSGSPIAFAKVHADLPLVAVDLAKDLASGRPVGDSVGTPTEQLLGLTDADAKTGITYKSSEPLTLELDLGRDRGIAQVDLWIEGDAVWPSIAVLGYQTGELASEATPLFTTNQGDQLLRTRGTPGSVPNVRVLRLNPRPLEARFLKIRVSGASTPVRITGIQVHPGLASKG